MEQIFENFKKYLLSLDSKQIENPKSRVSKHEDLQIIRKLVDHIKLVPAGEKEKEYTQYGTFFDGEHMFYEEGLEYSQETMNHVFLNHIIHFMLGANFTSFKNTSWYKSTTALFFAHFNISGITPKYGTSIRPRFYNNYHVPGKGYGTLFDPLTTLSNYFFEEYEAGNINFPKGFEIEKTDVYEFDSGVVYIASTMSYDLKGTFGIIAGNARQATVILSKNEDGTYKKVNGRTGDGKELLEHREVIMALTGDEDLFDD